ncbi:MAG: glutaredoxin domain-containing protein [Flavobacteriales bacterium]
MKPIIYVANRCHQCAMVKDFVKKSGVDTDIYNVDLSTAKPPIDIFVYPALFMESKLVAYGEDIIDYFEKELIN